MQHTRTHIRSAIVEPCPTCFGFPVVAVAISGRGADGSRRTNRVRCGTCRGSGHATDATPSARVMVPAGAAA